MKEYVDYLIGVYRYLILHPKEFNEVMKPNPDMEKYLATDSFSDETIEYCQPSPRIYIRVVELIEKENK